MLLSVQTVRKFRVSVLMMAFVSRGWFLSCFPCSSGASIFTKSSTGVVDTHFNEAVELFQCCRNIEFL